MPRRRILAAAVALALSAPVFESYSQSISPTALPTGGGVVASTLSMSADDFMSGRYMLRNGGSAGSVVNQGDIRGRSVVLVGPRVVNDGTIEAQSGTISLVAASGATLDLMADGLVQIRVDQGALQSEIVN